LVLKASLELGEKGGAKVVRPKSKYRRKLSGGHTIQTGRGLRVKQMEPSHCKRKTVI